MTEQRLINANLIPWEEHYVPDPDSNMQWDFKKELCVLKPAVDALPTVDAVEVVRCRECEHYVKLLGEDRRRCSIFSGCYDRPYPTEPEDFCSYGARKGSAYEK